MSIGTAFGRIAGARAAAALGHGRSLQLLHEEQQQQQGAGHVAA